MVGKPGQVATGQVFKGLLFRKRCFEFVLCASHLLSGVNLLSYEKWNIMLNFCSYLFSLSCFNIFVILITCIEYKVGISTIVHVDRLKMIASTQCAHSNYFYDWCFSHWLRHPFRLIVVWPSQLLKSFNITSLIAFHH